MATLNLAIFARIDELVDFVTATAAVTEASTERIFEKDNQWYLLYWTA